MLKNVIITARCCVTLPDLVFAYVPPSQALRDPQNGTACCLFALQGMPKGSPIELRADVGYDTRQIFEYCRGLGIVLLVRIKKNANSRVGGVGRTRGLAAQDQLCGNDPGSKRLAALDECERVQNQKDWKRRVGYGRRWLVEIVFSSLKRMFGGPVNAVKMENIVREIAIRINTYNRLLAVAREAIAGA